MIFARTTPGLTFRHLVIATALLGLGAESAVLAQFDTPRMSGLDAPPMVSQRPVPVYFPPMPPPLGRPVSRLMSTNSGLALPPPTELSTYVTEPFYAPLGTRLTQGDLGDKLRQKLNAYLAERQTLLGELRTELKRTRDDGAAARRSGLDALARAQSARLVELEATAEQLRSSLVTGESDWSALREWHLGDRNTRGDSPTEIAAVLRAFAFYQSGLFAEQRQLLREIVVEVSSGAEDTATATTRQPFLFFSPALTRVILPDSVPAEVATKVAQFETKKSTLKKELFDAVLAQERATFSFSRTSAMRTLALKQTQALGELDRLADEIRDGLADAPDMIAKEPRSPLPPMLTQRTMQIVEERTALQKASRAKIDAIIAGLPRDFPVVFSTTLDAQGAKIRLIPRPGARGRFNSADPLIAQTSARITEIGEEHRLRNEEINRAVEGLRDDAGRSLGQNATSKMIDEALNGVIRYNVERENEDAYRDYRIAVFQPGLSPAQRRLLLGDAIRKLDLPLPGGEMQPTRRAASW